MSHPEHSLPAASLRREEVARIEVGHTTVAPSTVRLLLAVFLAAIAVVPLAELGGAIARAEGTATAWSHLSGLPGDLRGHFTGDVADRADERLWRRVVTANRRVLAALTAFEDALDDESGLGRALRPPAQVVMSGWIGAGNERVYVGRDGWLFYRPDVEYLTGPGFLDTAVLERRAAAAAEWETPPQPDPREALLRFKRDLDLRGIALVVVPTPIKAGVHPERLARRYARAPDGLQNPSYRAFVDDLARAGVLVFDPSEVLTAVQSAPQYLATDTHWRPEAMEAVAERLASFVTARVPLPAAPDPGHVVEQQEVSNRGDTARMLDLPDWGASLFPPETIYLRRILRPDGSLWRSTREADVLVLGDSFSNIYSLESMDWGTSAGLVEQLSDALRRPIDRLVQNDEGAFATRLVLLRDPGRLDGKRVVIHQFAVRELAFGDWRILPMDQP